MPLPMIGSDDALNAAQSSAMIMTRPIAPIGSGLRALNGLPPTLTLRVLTPISIHSWTASFGMRSRCVGSSLAPRLRCASA